MLQPDQITERLRARFEHNYPDWARGRGHWPMRISLQPPTTTQRSTDPVACHAWAALWDTYQGAGTIEYVNLRFPTATHPMPKTLLLAHPGQAASIHPHTHRTWQRCGRRLTHLQRAFPEAIFEGIIRRVTDLDERDYHTLIDTVAWLRAHPTSGLLLRQLPIEGIDTKWLLKHRVLVLALLGTREDPTDLETAAGNASPASARMRLHHRLGLRTPPELVHVAVLDSGLRTHVGGMRHFAASVEDLNQWRHPPHTVIILENKETGYAITEDHPGAVVLHGHGFSVVNYARITWVRAAHTVIYWGDIDAPGLQFVSDLRGLGVNAHTVLMDTTTLEQFRHLSTDGAGPQRSSLPHLTEAEQELYSLLCRHAIDHSSGLLLEQERISWPHASKVLLAAMHQAHKISPAP
ncbi:Wadjet anti-phage system protein JetD domain-containing protein [Streptosporangium canum]|uniref:Wadjet anti-phage system protein JetD domain-containing protein n=1 Tax=Streptosporangium canum TaxID=324952 RepID=UPI0036777687